ncbi:Uncharacterized protein OBRU01_00362 [Operophtera brumata]|uniref:Uncharacterized protein n=1 Tax=Operophtera brumata TaxID=104452 RepID=A0A0L7LVG3_OPEBR|nr:Uncharacterized protein OBRU01_00362 [Operophtera brumata]
MAGRDSLEGQLTQVIQHHMSQGTEAQVSVHQVQSPSGSGTKRHQIIIDIKQDIDLDATRSLAESVMETLGARSAAVYIDNSVNESNELESLTTVNVIVANDLTQVASPQPEPELEIQETEPGILPGNRIAVDRIVELSNAASASETTTTNTVSITTASTTASDYSSFLV